MKETNKLWILISHWITHNQDNATEFREWTIQADEATSEILSAATQMSQINACLEPALEKLSGALNYNCNA
jgi:hypothetical protein